MKHKKLKYHTNVVIECSNKKVKKPSGTYRNSSFDSVGLQSKIFIARDCLFKVNFVRRCVAVPVVPPGTWLAPPESNYIK
jgi:hypothetical protein